MKGSNVKESHTLPKFQILVKLNCNYSLFFTLEKKTPLVRACSSYHNNTT